MEDREDEDKDWYCAQYEDGRVLRRRAEHVEWEAVGGAIPVEEITAEKTAKKER